MEESSSGSLKELNENEASNKIYELEEELMKQKVHNKMLNDKLKKVLEDFNYNVELIYGRDKEIDLLNSKVDHLVETVKEKDLQILHLQGLYKKVKQLENDKLILVKKLEALMSTSNYPQTTQNRTTEHKPTIKNFPIPRVYSQSQDSSRLKTFPKPSEEIKPAPLSRMNSDLEKRIKALESENGKKKSSQDSSPDIASTDRISIKEQEISELIKSLSSYKKDFNRSSVHNSYDSSLNNKSLHSIKSPNKPAFSYHSYIQGKSVNRCVSSLEKDIN